jgi:hypothetical protein
VGGRGVGKIFYRQMEMDGKSFGTLGVFDLIKSVNLGRDRGKRFFFLTKNYFQNALCLALNIVKNTK